MSPWRVVGGLFKIDRYTVYHALVGLTKNSVEGLFHADDVVHYYELISNH